MADLRFFNADLRDRKICFTFAGHFNIHMIFHCFRSWYRFGFLFLLTTLFLTSCAQNQASKAPGTASKDDPALKNVSAKGPLPDSLVDELASVIAGIGSDKICRELTTGKEWVVYQQQIKSDWKLVEKNKTGPISRWREKNINPGKTDTTTLFYPFAGADFLYANAFFPDARNYLLIGLEPIGKLHRCDTMKRADFLAYLEKIRSAMYYSNHLGFFRTLSMEEDLNQQSLDGTLPLIVFYIRKTGHHITRISYFTIDKNGKMEPCSQDTATIGVKVDFTDSTMTRKQSLCYLSYDLSDKNLKKHPELLEFVTLAGSQACFLKAASYLMFTADFQVMKNYLLDNEKSILQDDSGIPYRFFRSKKWDVKLFGDYTQTIDLFKYKFQPDLQAAYEKLEKKNPVPFRIGYNVKFNETNLLFATRKN
ncbi:MAG: hypothetical protein NTU98_05025 [Bacteroidetes bacterium]|nr:hypothetical protein [Bacteroidota bacterium]